MSRPRALKASAESTQTAPSTRIEPRIGTPKTRAAKPSRTPTSMMSIVSRDRTNEARYCVRDIGVAISRFSSFFRRESTIANPRPQIPLPIRFMPSSPGTTKST